MFFILSWLFLSTSTFLYSIHLDPYYQVAEDDGFKILAILCLFFWFVVLPAAIWYHLSFKL